MKKLTILFALSLALTAGAQAVDTSVQFRWNPPVGVLTGEVDSFSIYYSFNAAIAPTNWTKLTNFAASVNGTAWVTNKTVFAPAAAKCFFFITSSNFWGDSLYWGSISNITNTPSLPPGMTGLGLTK